MATFDLLQKARDLLVVHNFLWEIKNVSNCQNLMNSEPFSPLSSIPLQFCLRLERHKDDNDFKVKLIRFNEAEIPKAFSVKMEILIWSRDVTIEKRDRISIKKSATLYDFKELFLFTISLDTHKKTIKVNEYRAMLFDSDSLILRCIITFHGLPAWQTFINRYCNIFEDFKSLYESKHLADVTITIGEDVLKAHRFVLSARSPVLNAMMNHDCLETSNQECLETLNEDSLETMNQGCSEIMHQDCSGEPNMETTLNEDCSETPSLQPTFSQDCSKTPKQGPSFCENCSEIPDSTTKTIEIGDSDTHTIDCFLLYLYCCEIKDTSFETIQKLYVLAKKFSVPDLERDCALILAATLSMDTVCCVLELGHLLQDKVLKKKATDYIICYFAEVKETPGWETIANCYSELASEIVGRFSSAFE